MKTKHIDVLRRRTIKRRPIPDPGSSATILYFSKTQIEPLRAPYSATVVGWAWKEGHSTKLCTCRFRPKAQPLNLLCTTFDRKSTPSMLYWYPFHAPSKNTASLLTIVNAPSFHDTKPRYLKLWIRQRSFCPFHSLRCVCQPAFKSLYRTKWWISLPFQNLPTLSYAWSLKRYDVPV